MPFSAKVIETKEMFMAATEAANETMENHHDATLPLRPELMYQGALLVGSYVGNSFYIEYTEQETRSYKGSDLEAIMGDLRLIPMHSKPENTEPDVDAELAKAAKAMNAAEDALNESGFSVDQWMLIKSYVNAAILHSQWALAKGTQTAPLS